MLRQRRPRAGERDDVLQDQPRVPEQRREDSAVGIGEKRTDEVPIGQPGEGHPLPAAQARQLLHDLPVRRPPHRSGRPGLAADVEEVPPPEVVEAAKGVDAGRGRVERDRLPDRRRRPEAPDGGDRLDDLR